MSIQTAVFAGFIGALFAPFVYDKLKAKAGWLIAVLPFSLFCYFLRYLQPENQGNVFSEIYPWIPSMGLNLAFQVDGLSLLFALIITGIGTFIIIYAGGYMGNHVHTGRLYAYLLMFMGSMLGVVLSSNLLCLFIFWELTSVSSFFLIGFDSERPAARRAATQALLVTGLGGLGLLVGFLFLGNLVGSFHITDIAAQSNFIKVDSLYLPILLLVLFGAFTKSAQLPFHFWLPGAMEAPTPVSAYLHSATMVKAGIYLLARFSPILGGTEIWQTLLISFGLATMFIGAFQSFLKTDLKQILAYSTVSVLGLLVFLLGIPSEKAVKGAIVFLLAHALSKATLFLVAGSIDHGVGTKDINKLGGLRKYMPVIFVASVLAVLSKIGAPPFFGFLGKELIYEAALKAKEYGYLLIGVAVLSNILLVGAILNAGIKPFFGKKGNFPKSPHAAPLELWIGPVVLSFLGIFFGISPGLIEKGLLSSSITATVGHSVDLHLKLWHGFNTVLVLSLLTLALGIIVYSSWSKIKSLFDPINVVNASKIYDASLDALHSFSKFLTNRLQSGYLRYYLIIILLLSVFTIGFKVFQAYFPQIQIDLSDIHFHEFGICLIIILAGFWCMFARTFLMGIMALGIVGYGIATIFIFFEAPDLAITQFIIETLTLILFLAILSHFPKFSNVSSSLNRAGDFLIAFLVGGMMTTLVLIADSFRLPKVLTDYFATHSYLEAHGRNIVNVILVDFRGLDTFGEITVLAIAGLSVYALVKLKPNKKN